MKKSITQLDKEKIIYNYTILNRGLKAIEKELGIGYRIVRKVLVENNIPIKKVGNSKKYKINDTYFNIQNPNMAYIMGFWAADGNVSTSENRLDLELASKDREILEKINTELSNERPVKVYKCANGYEKNKVLFWSKEIKEQFISYGIVPNKTYSEDFHAPFKLDKKYWIDYIRGFFDGDGCIKKSGYSITFELNSLNKKFLEDIQDFLFQEYSIKMHISTTGIRKNTLYRLYCYGENAKKIFAILYTPNSLYLDRKYQTWLTLLNIK